MPAEIADSDAESDVASQKAPSYSPIERQISHDPPIDLLSTDPLNHVDFSQYLSPTQRLSSMIEQREAALPCSTGSTDRFLKEIDQAQEGLLESTNNWMDGGTEASIRESTQTMPKNGLDDIESGTLKRKKDSQTSSSSAKRSKTYGHTRSLMSDNAYADSTDGDTKSLQASLMPKNHSAGNPKSRDADKPDSSNGDQDITSKGGSRSRRPMSLIESGFKGLSHSFSTTRSSMGGYQGINLDFRGVGLDISDTTNPFGSLSQVSEGEVRLVDSNDSEGTSGQRNVAANEDYNGSERNDMTNFQQQMATSPLQELQGSSTSRNTHVLAQVTENQGRDVEDNTPAHGNDSEGQQTTIKAAADSDSHENNRNETIDEAVASTSKKRGRKRRISSSLPKLSDSKDMEADELAGGETVKLPSKERDKSHSGRSRPGIEEFFGAVSEATEDVDIKQRKRKRSENPEAQSSPLKQLTSEAMLSDEAAIGLPRENYKPKPSRSRSKKVVEEPDDLDQVVLQPPSQDPATTNNNTEDGSPSGKPSKKVGRKSKVKRAKTSAAALLRKTQEMLDEDEKDVIFMEERPAEVKMKLPPSLSPLKKEQDGGNDEVSMQSVEKAETPLPDDSTTFGSKKTHVSVDVPPRLSPVEESKPAPPEPKKRGRKPKKKPDVAIEPVIDEAPDDTIAESAQSEEVKLNGRQPLAEKDANVSPPASLSEQTSKSNLSTDKQPTPPSDITTTDNTVKASTPKPTHSPIKPSPSLSSILTKPRIGLSRRMNIPSLLRKLDRSKEAPKVVEKKEKLTKKQKELEEKRQLEAEVDGLDGDEDGSGRWKERGADGMLVEWND